MSELYGNIRVDNGKRKIGVNDNGDYIEISVNDRELHSKFANLLDWLEKQQQIIEKKGKELSRKHGNGPLISEDEDGKVEVNASALVDVTSVETECHKECCEKIDEVFGKDTCKKVFGDVIPDFALIEEFFEQITPVLQKLSEERGEKISNRYTRRQMAKGKRKKQRSKEELIADYKKE